MNGGLEDEGVRGLKEWMVGGLKDLRTRELEN